MEDEVRRCLARLQQLSGKKVRGWFGAVGGEGRLVFVCLHPTASYHLEILREIADEYLFVAGGRVAVKPDFRTLIADEGMRAYLGADMTAAADATI